MPIKPKKRGPWLVKEKVYVYQHPRLAVREDKVVRPDGVDGTHNVIEAEPGVSVLAMDGQGNVYLVKEFKYALGGWSIEVATGGRRAGEKPLAGAKRELKEELGIQAKKWKSIGTISSWNAVIAMRTYLFLARDLSFGGTNHEPSEVIKPVKVSFAGAMKMVMTGKITHAPSCVLILKVKELMV